MSCSSSAVEETSGDEFELMEMITKRKRPEHYSYMLDTVPLYNDGEFIEHFRVSRRVAEDISAQYQKSSYFSYQAGKYGKLQPLQQILIFLWFVGHEAAGFRDVADRFGVAISTFHKIVKKVGNFISNLSPNVIKWPSPHESLVIERYFNENGFPGVIGLIDCTHIKIDKPPTDPDPDSYLNRKNDYTIKLQIVCDHELRIRDVCVGYPGSVPDATVFQSSLAKTLEDKCLDMYILGDSAYPCLRNLLTPYQDNGHLTRQQANFNRKLVQSRCGIEHCFGLLKQKFGQLYHMKLRNIPDVVHFIRACCVLHNLALKDNYYYEEEQVGHAARADDDGSMSENQDDVNGVHMRNHVATLLDM